ncbi:protein-glutamate methylesterase/protein-glutamine glutaminase [Demequina mangrovi]|uniref:Protein-glutamate methylesterase/protein-glutamine glutaminase n=1 Tax=Demequina mangrovi TaxID=1043493 RepID=A0A1H6ZU19_9MICO|nr:chemotaxis response regulator protein-glutamate methylesterase [Demequina mangrovi]SEJ55684.1 two-component system, chemotaxis family, response regulator CheB [Demequina mangrovi]
MAPIRVLVVDDSVVVRRIVSEALASDPAIEVVGVAQNGSIALTKVAALKPDLITMDIEMPVMDGIEAVRALRRSGVRTPIVMFSTLTSHGASATLDALAAGASDYATKPTQVANPAEAVAVITSQLIPKVKALCGASPVAASAARPRSGGALTRAPRAIVVGSSTGGPEALSKLFGALDAPLPVPVLVVQHMPPMFTTQLAARLDRIGPSTVVEASGNERLVPGTVYIAPGDLHLEVKQLGAAVVTAVSGAPQVNFCRPAVDVLFRSAVRTFGGDLLGVVLTGMGSDGRDGARELVDAGGRMIAQDQATSVVWGMPGAVAAAGLAHEILPLESVAGAVARAAQGRLSGSGVRA